MCAMQKTPVDPLTGPIPDQVPLDNAPLVTVLCQVRFPTALYIRDAIPKFQASVRHDYPELRQEQVVEVAVTPSGPPQMTPSSIWRFLDKTRSWTVSVTSDFVTLETKKYTSREDFLHRLRTVMQAASSQLEVSNYNRIGLRYIDQIKGRELSELKELINPALAGLVNENIGDRVEQSLTQTVFNLPKPPKSKMVVHYGMLAKNTTHDPGALRPIAEKSWILDIDLYREFTAEERLGEFDPQHIAEMTRAMSERIYAFFRWATTDKFIQRYKG